MRLALPAIVVFAILLVPATALAERVEVANTAPGVKPTRLYEGLAAPVDLAFGPDGTLYYAELMEGNLRAIRPGASAPDPEPIWRAPALEAGGERGFVGLALDPDFATTRAFYVYYTHNAGDKVVGRLSRVVDGEETVLLTIDRVGLLHNAGRIAFMPDKTILLSVGDAILDTDDRRKSLHSHDPADQNGKVLHVTREGKAAPGNPWGTLAWTKGHRNVFGLAVSPDGVVIGTENGPDRGDEINLLEPGRDYGWPTCVAVCGQSDYTDPILWWERTIAPTGATWHRGAFYFGAFNNGNVSRLDPPADEGGAWGFTRVLKLAPPRILDVESGPDALYVSTWEEIWRVELPDDLPRAPTPTPDPAPTPSAATGGTGGTGGGAPSPSPGGPADVGGGVRDTPAPPVALLVGALATLALARRARRGA